MRYAFGDSDLASRRLALLAEVFEPSSRAFLRRAGPSGAALAVDLGCGPGFTTRLLAETLAAARTTGMDTSESFLAQARAAVPACAFAAHDVGVVPFPTGPADLLYARFLLCHLPEPLAVLSRWAGQLRAGGRLLCEEVEWIRSEEPAFVDYLALVDQTLAARDQRLYIGEALAGALSGGARRGSTELCELEVAPADAAGMFALNLETLGQDEVVRARYGAADLAALAARLEAIRGGAPTASIRWGLRQVVVEA
jgi:SAM-dependent methyltransferase